MDALEQIALYNSLYYVSMGIAVVGLILSVTFFFIFDIPSVYAMMTGKARRQTIQRMEDQNAKTGNLRFRSYTQMGLNAQTGRTGKTGPASNTGRTEKKHSQPLRQEEAPHQVMQDAPETNVVYTETPQTTVLQEQAEVTTLLSEEQPAQGSQQESPPPNQKDLDFPFLVTEAIIVTHTNEIIT